MKFSNTVSFFFGVTFGSIVVAGLGIWLFIDHDGDDDKRNKKKALLKRYLRGGRGQNSDDDDNDDASSDDDIDGLDGGGSFLTSMMSRLWPHVRIVANDMMMDMITEMLMNMKSPKMTLKTIDFGPNPIRMDNCVVHSSNQSNNNISGTIGGNSSNSISIDFDMVWDAVMDIQLHHDLLGNFGLQHMLLLGRMNLVLQPCTGYDSSIILGMTCTFINTPTIKLSLKGVAKLAENNTMIRTMIDDTIKDTLNSMIVLPIRFPYKLSPNNVHYYDMHKPPIGYVRIRPIKGRGFVVQRQAIQGDDVPDVYMNISLGGNSEIYRTRTIPNSLSPVWNKTLNKDHVENSDEYHDFLLCDYGQQLYIDVYDEDNGIIDNVDDYLGTVHRISIRELVLRCNTNDNNNNNGSGCVELQLNDKNNNNKFTGAYITLQCQVRKFNHHHHHMNNTKSTTNKNEQQEEEGTTTTMMMKETKVKTTTTATTKTKYGCYSKYGLLTILVSHAVNVPLLNTATNTNNSSKTTSTTDSVYVVVEQQQQQEQQPTSNTTTTTSTTSSAVYKTAAVTDSPGYDPSNPVFDTTLYVPLLSTAAAAAASLTTMSNIDQYMESYKISLMNNDKVIASTIIQPKHDFIDVGSSVITRKIKFGSSTSTATSKEEKQQQQKEGGDVKEGNENENDDNANDSGGYFEFQAMLYGVNEIPTTTIPKDDEDILPNPLLSSETGVETSAAAIAIPAAGANSVAAIAPSSSSYTAAVDEGTEAEDNEDGVVVTRSRSIGYSKDDKDEGVASKKKEASTSSSFSSAALDDDNNTANTTIAKSVTTTTKTQKNTLVLRIRLISGRGFQVQKLSFGRRDIPDVYCIIRVGGGIGGGDEWRTTTIRDNVSPIWPYEVHDFVLGHKRAGSSTNSTLVQGNNRSYRNQTISIRVWDEDTNDSDDFLGYIRMSIKRLLNLVDENNKHKVELELLNDNNNGGGGGSSGQRPTGAYITLSCQLIWK